mgnify:CR=1 FL=1
MKRKIIGAAVATVVALIVNLVWFSSVFDVRTVKILGTKLTTTAQVRAAAAIELGQPVARVDVAAAAERIRAIRVVESVDVRRGLPHTIVIDVHERVPIAATTADDGTWWLVDKHGVMFRKVPQLPAGLTIVQAYTELFRGIGARMAAGMPDWLRQRVATVSVYAEEDIRLEMKNGKLVRWGGEEKADRKAEVLYVLLKIPAKQYDVSAPNAPATKK